MCRYLYYYLMLALVLTGCASSPRTFTAPVDVYNPPAEYTFSYDAIYADLFWRCTTPQEGGIHVQGYAIVSMRSNMAIRDFEVRLIARDAKENILADRWKYGDLLNASNIDPVPFAIALAAAGEVARYDLYYSFKVPGGNGGRATGPYQGTRVQLVSQGAFDYFGTIEDVCGARHRRKEVPPGS